MQFFLIKKNVLKFFRQCLFKKIYYNLNPSLTCLYSVSINQRKKFSKYESATEIYEFCHNFIEEELEKEFYLKKILNDNRCLEIASRLYLINSVISWFRKRDLKWNKENKREHNNSQH